MFEVIALDADDTLWDNEYLYSEAKKKFIQLLSECSDPEACAQRLDEIEMENVRCYGYGIKSFILSMIEAALELSEGRVAAENIAAILGFAREMLSAEVRLIDGVGETLASLAQNYPLMLITKGDPSEQQRKIEDSGLGVYFRWVEVVADKSPAIYRSILERYGLQRGAVFDGRQLAALGHPAGARDRRSGRVDPLCQHLGARDECRGNDAHLRHTGRPAPAAGIPARAAPCVDQRRL